jgi:DNA mismatch repair protein MutS2
MQLNSDVREKIGFETIRAETEKYLYTPTGRQWIRTLQPLSIDSALDERRSQMGELLWLASTGQSLPFSRLDDVQEALQRTSIQGAMLSAIQCYQIREHVVVARKIRSKLLSNREHMPTFMPILRGLHELKEVEASINGVINDRAEVKNDASKELRAIRSDLQKTKQKIRSVVDRMLKRLRSKGMAPEEGATLREGRLVIPIYSEHKRQVDGLLQDISGSGKTSYVEPKEVVDLNNDIRLLDIRETREVERILKELTAKIGQYRHELETNEATLGFLDGMQGMLTLSRRWDGVSPALSPDETLRLKKAKNPTLLLAKESTQDEMNVVPLHLELDPSERVLITTGPNAGGKSVAMKTVGLLCVMHQCGYALPLDPDSTLPKLQQLYVDIGDEQSIENDLSTFSSRLKWMKDTLESPMKGSLVLIDEAGTGTDPEEGGALFQAFIETCLERGARVITTTHHGSLKLFAHATEGVVNGAMEFNQETLSPTYNFHKNTPGSSYAFEIASRMGVPSSVTTRARELLGTQTSELSSLLQELEKKVHETQELKKKLDKRQKALDEIEAKRAAKRGKRSTTPDDDTEPIIPKNGTGKASKGKKGRAKAASLQKEDLPPIGTEVRLVGSQTPGILVDITDRFAVVEMNGLQIKSQFDRLRLPKTKKKKVTKKSSKGTVKRMSLESSPKGTKPGAFDVKTELDIRGKRANAAEADITQYIDRALAKGLSRVDIIHGKGTGVLMSCVKDTLTKRTDIQSFRVAPYDEGGPGKTIVQLA